MDALGLDWTPPWCVPVWCVSVWTFELTCCGFVSRGVISRTSFSVFGDVQCQTPNLSPPPSYDVQNLTMHFSQLQARHFKSSFPLLHFVVFFTLQWEKLLLSRWISLLSGPCGIFSSLHAFKHNADWHNRPDPINTNICRSTAEHTLSFAQLFFTVRSTVHSVFPPLFSHLGPFSCHLLQNKKKAKTHYSDRSCTQSSQTKSSRSFCTDWRLSFSFLFFTFFRFCPRWMTLDTFSYFFFPSKQS